MTTVDVQDIINYLVRFFFQVWWYRILIKVFNLYDLHFCEDNLSLERRHQASNCAFCNNKNPLIYTVQSEALTFLFVARIAADTLTVTFHTQFFSTKREKRFPIKEPLQSLVWPRKAQHYWTVLPFQVSEEWSSNQRVTIAITTFSCTGPR